MAGAALRAPRWAFYNAARESRCRYCRSAPASPLLAHRLEKFWQDYQPKSVYLRHSAGESVWIGELAGAPKLVPKQEGQHDERHERKRTAPGPLDLACFGMVGGGHQPCVYTSHPLAAGPLEHWDGHAVCGASLSIYASMKT